VVAEISASLDGFIAGPNQTLEEPLGAGGEKLHEWGVRLRTVRKRIGCLGGAKARQAVLLAVVGLLAAACGSGSSKHHAGPRVETAPLWTSPAEPSPPGSGGH
jgi:hypothetical protein